MKRNIDYTTEQALENALYLLAEAEAFVGADNNPAAIDLLDHIVAFQQMLEPWVAKLEAERASFSAGAVLK